MVGARDVGAPEPVEDGVTFVENALIKARALAAFTGLPAVADDSGLSVDVLGGAPGIFSARWAGRHGDDAANLDAPAGAAGRHRRAEHRAARFVCAAALVTPGRLRARRDRRRSRACWPPSRAGPAASATTRSSCPTGETRSCAELTPQEKNAISHRGTAFRALVPTLVRVLGG